MSIQWLFDVIEERKKNPSEKSYTTSLFKDGLPKIAQKVGEEGTEVVVAALAQDDQRLIEEVADLTYHTLVLLAARGLTPSQIGSELEKRHRKDSYVSALNTKNATVCQLPAGRSHQRTCAFPK